MYLTYLSRTHTDIVYVFIVVFSILLPKILYAFLVLFLVMSSSEAGRHLEYVDIVMPKFDHLCWNQICFIKHFLGYLLFSWRLVSFVEFLLPGVTSSKRLVLEKSKLRGRYYQLWELLPMLFVNDSCEQSTILFKKRMIAFLQIFNDNILYNMKRHRIRTDIELAGDNLKIVHIFALHFSIFIKQFLLLGSIELHKFKKLKFAQSKTII